MRLYWFGVPLLLFGCYSARAQVNVLTANGDNSRTSSNLQEVDLSPATVGPDSFGKIGSLPVDGQVYSQILVAAGIQIPGRGLRNVLYICTMHNSVYAFDAGAVPPYGLLWRASLGTPVPAAQLYGPYGDVANEVGIMGTGVIDLQRGVLYVVADTQRSGSPVFQLHALDLATGAERLSGPVDITASVAGTGVGAQPNGTLVFNAQQHLQRPGLLLANDTVYVGFGSHGDQSPWHGWLMSYDANDLHQTGIFNTTPNGAGGALWQSGRGIAADTGTGIFAITGNGDYDGVSNFGQSFLRLSGAPAVRTGAYTPPDWKSMSDNDFDISAGPALVPGTNTLVGGDKMGNVYLLNRDTMDKVGDGPAFFPGAQSSIFSIAVWGRGADSLVYVQGSREPLKSYHVSDKGFDPTPAATAPLSVTYSRIGMTLSADGARSDSGILWQTTGNYNDASAAGTLHAYDATSLAELWNSDMNAVRDVMPPVAKFVGPTIANGRVYVPTFGNAVLVYGLVGDAGRPAPVITAVANSATYEPRVVSPGEMVTIFGTDLGPPSPAGLQLDSSGSVATDLGGTSVLFGTVPGPMALASTGQINTLVPFGAEGDLSVVVEVDGRISVPFSVTVQDSSPGVFSLDASGRGQAAAINEDGTVNTPDNPAPAGSIIALYATGFGKVDPPGKDGAVAQQLKRVVLPVSAMIGNQAATVMYAGTAPGIVEGIVQVNVQIPADAPADPALPLVLTAGSHSSLPGITIAVRQDTQ